MSITELLPSSGSEGSAPRATFLTRPGFGEQTLAFITLFVTAVGLPHEWFVAWDPLRPTDTSGSALISVVFLGLASLLATRLINNWGVVLDAVRVEPLFVVLLVVAFASVFWSPEPVQTFRRVGAFSVATLLGYYLVVRLELAKIIELVALMLIAVTLLNFIWVFALPQYGLEPTGTARNWTGITSNRNVLGRLTALSALTFAIGFRLFPARRLLYGVFLLLQVPIVLGAGSKTSLASLVLTLALLVVYQLFRARKTLYGAVAISLSGSTILGTAIATANIDVITRFLDRDVTLSGRTKLWGDLYGEAASRPIGGAGWEAYWGGWYSPAHDIWIRHNWLPPTAHNVYLDMALNVGLLGLIPLVVLLVRGVIRASRHIRYTPGPLGLWPLGYISMVLMISNTESGLAGRTIFWPLLVVAVDHASRQYKLDEQPAVSIR